MGEGKTKRELRNTMKLSAGIITKNEESHIEKCLMSLKFCGELVVIDDNSIDKTREISKKLGAKVFNRSSEDDYSGQRNYALTKTRGDWILFIDADERVSKKLQNEILKSISQNTFSGFKLKRQDIFLRKKLKYGEAANVELVRLAKRNSGIWERPVHEIWNVKGKIGKLENRLTHIPHPNISSFIERVNRYTTIESKYRISIGQKGSLLEMLFFPVGKFVANYIFLFGFKDGFPGLIMAYIMSLHSLVVRIKIIDQET
jgi:glycosyltransferase involved in cell wall biosynthesis